MSTTTATDLCDSLGEEPIRVLHVDDSEQDRYRRDRALQRAGFSVLSVGYAHAALERLLGGEFDAVLLDVRLPDADGFELTRCIKALAAAAEQEIGIVLVSAYFVESDYRVAGLEAGADAYLIEPVADAELLATLRSVVRLRRALKAARDQQRLLDTIFEQVPDGITFATAPDVTIQRVSRYGQQLTGRPYDDLLNIPAPDHPTRWGIFRADGMTPAIDAELPLTRATCDGESVTNEEWLLRRPDGTSVVLLCNAAPVRNARGEPIGGLIAWRDITDRKQLEDDLRASNRAKDDFLAGVAHELRQPLSAALAALAVMETRSSREGGERARRIVHRQLRHMSRMIEDLLDVSRLTRGQISLPKQPIDLRQIVEEASEVVRPLMDDRRHEWRVVVPDEPVIVKGDSGRLQQIIVNLLTNAARYTDPGGHIQLRIETEAAAVRVVVIDDGQGIPKPAQHRIFDLFTRATDKAGGLGMGLAIVRSLVQLHGGTVEVYSEGAGRGSRFTVTLPDAETSEEAIR